MVGNRLKKKNSVDAQLLDMLCCPACHGELVQPVLALSLSGLLSSRIHGGQEHAGEHADDGDHHQHFDQRKSGPRGWLASGAPTTCSTANHRNPPAPYWAEV